MEKRAFFLTHQFVRCLADFGNVLNFLDREGYAVTIYTLPAVDVGETGSYTPKMVDEYRTYLPPTIKVEHLPHTVPYRLGK